VDAIVPIASTHALQPQGVAWNAIARNAITSDPDWQGGHYYGTGARATPDMGVARMVGHITYLSARRSRHSSAGACSSRRHPLHAHDPEFESRATSATRRTRS
jgi:homoserine acetyltransferase